MLAITLGLGTYRTEWGRGDLFLRGVSLPKTSLIYTSYLLNFNDLILDTEIRIQDTPGLYLMCFLCTATPAPQYLLSGGIRGKFVSPSANVSLIIFDSINFSRHFDVKSIDIVLISLNELFQEHVPARIRQSNLIQSRNHKQLSLIFWTPRPSYVGFRWQHGTHPIVDFLDRNTSGI
jgi:hypothetical protein